MCEITVDNFNSKFKEIDTNLKQADFIAIDTEFTGLHLDGAQPSIIDCVEKRYTKMKKSIQLFNLVQMGISTFRYCNENKAFMVDTYNFYLFPRNYGIFKGDQINSFQTSGVEFLCKYDFDFNKLIYKGLSFMNNQQEKMLTAALKKEISSDRNIDDRDIQKICMKVSDWLESARADGDFMDINCKRDMPHYIIHQELRDRFKSVWTYELDTRQIRVKRISEEKRLEYEKNDPNNEIKQMIDDLLGFTKIFRLMTQYKKPLVVHNGFMDLLYMYQKFYEPLPNTMKQFKKNFNELFPFVYDTKHISLECKKLDKNIKELYESTCLENLYNGLNREVLKKYPLFLIPIKHSQSSSIYSVKQLPHEAGFDAFMCGAVFLRLAHVLTMLDSKKCYHVKPNNMKEFFIIMKPFLNKCKLIKASLDHVNLEGPDPSESVTKYLLIKCKRAKLSTADLLNIVSPFGESEIISKSPYSAYVAVDSLLSATNIMNALKTSKDYEASICNRWQQSSIFYNGVIGGCLAAGAGLIAYSIISYLKD